MVDNATSKDHLCQPMTKVSRKTLKKKSRKRTDHPAGCRVNDAELAAVNADINELERLGGIRPSVGAYVKHALLSHARLRKLEASLAAFYKTHRHRLDGLAADIVEGNEPDAPGGEFGGKPVIPAFEGFAKAMDELKAILEVR